MTVSELINILNQYDANATVFLRNDEIPEPIEVDTVYSDINFILDKKHVVISS